MKPLISIIHPSRGRPEMAFETFKKWFGNWGGNGLIQYILSIDTDDKSDYKNLIDSGVLIVSNENNNVVDAMNSGAKLAAWPILVCISDDFDCPQNWDELILQNIDPEKEEALRINDTIMKFDCMSLPIMTKKLYDKLGYIYYPKYTGLFADTDLLEQCKRMGVLKTNIDLIFPHNHYINGKAKFDATYARHNNKKSFELGKRIFDQRKLNNFTS